LETRIDGVGGVVEQICDPCVESLEEGLGGIPKVAKEIADFGPERCVLGWSHSGAVDPGLVLGEVNRRVGELESEVASVKGLVLEP